MKRVHSIIDTSSCIYVYYFQKMDIAHHDRQACMEREVLNLMYFIQRLQLDDMDGGISNTLHKIQHKNSKYTQYKEFRKDRGYLSETFFGNVLENYVPKSTFALLPLRNWIRRLRASIVVELMVYLRTLSL